MLASTPVAVAAWCMLPTAPARGEVASADAYAKAAQFHWGQSNAALVAVEAEVRSANGGQLRAVEAKLLKLLQSQAATADAKSWACRLLRVAGSTQSVPVLAGLLTDKKLASDAQFALRCIAGPEVDAALRDAVGRTSGLLKAGVIQTLGARRDALAVGIVAPLIFDPETTVAEASFYALGQIGGADGRACRAALAALKDRPAGRLPDGLIRARRHAMLLCAERLCCDGNKAEAGAIYRKLYGESTDDVIRTGALRGLIAAEQEKAADVLRDALCSRRAVLRRAAATLVCETADDALSAAALAQFAAWPSDTQAMVLGAMAKPNAAGAVRNALASADTAVRAAALGALARLGDPSSVPVLTEAAAAAGPAQSAARRSLQVMRGRGVDDALLAAAQQGPAAVRAEAIAALAARGTVRAVPTLVRLASDAESAVRSEAVKSLGHLAEAKDVPVLVAVLLREKGDRERTAIESALLALARRAQEKESVAGPLAAALAGASPESRAGLLRALSQAPCAQSLLALRASLQDSDVSVRETAIRGLAGWPWPDASVLPDLQAIAKTADKASVRQAALRGLVRLVRASAKDRPAQEAARQLTGALASARTVEEKSEVLAALGESGHADALAPSLRCLADPALEVEAAKAIVRLARKLQASNPDAAAAAIERLQKTLQSPEARRIAEASGVVLPGMVNVAPSGVATSPDGHEKDGASSGDQAAIDANPETYWDEVDGQSLYRLVVTFPKPEKIAALSLAGYGQHEYATKDFEMLCDGRVVKKVVGAEYVDNLLVVEIPETSCRTVELKITGYYGASPAIRELGLYRRAAEKNAEKKPAK